MKAHQYHSRLTELPAAKSTQASLALFDFDGTVTHKDSMFDFIRFAVGSVAFWLGLIRVSPVLIAYRMGVWVDATRAKESLLSQFFKHWPTSRFHELGQQYALHRLPKIVRNQALARIRAHQALGHEVVIVTASIETWLRAWCDQSNISLIGSRLLETNGVITGELLGDNCNGAEKVNRTNLLFDLYSFDQVYAYGDTPGDWPMLNLADHAFYRVF